MVTLDRVYDYDVLVIGSGPGGQKKTPIVIPFNGEQHAGVRVLNTSEFPVDAGPLSDVHR